MVHDKTPKYGNDDDYADSIMQDVFNLYHDLITGRPTMRGGKYGVDMLPTTCHVYFGEVIGATANGRTDLQQLSNLALRWIILQQQEHF